MTKENYLNKRNNLLAMAESLINEGKAQEATAKMGEVEALDKAFEDVTKAQANLNAMKDNHKAINLTQQSVRVEGEQVANSFSSTPSAKDEKKLYNSAFAKVLMNKPLTHDEQTAFNNVNDMFRNTVQNVDDHQILIPETVQKGIWKEIAESHPLYADLNPTFVPGDLVIIKETSEGTDAEWVDEKTQSEDDELGFGHLKLTGCELQKTVTISWKMKKMSPDYFLSYIQTRLAEKMGNALANGIINGKGKPSASEHKPQARGIVTALEAQGSTPQVVTYSTSMAYTDLTALVSKIRSGYLNGAAIYANNKTIWSDLANVLDANGRPIFIPDVTAGGVGRILGLVVKEEASVKEGALLLGNVAKGYSLNINENVTMYQEDHVKTRTTDYTAYAIVDGDVLTENAFAYLKKQ